MNNTFIRADEPKCYIVKGIVTECEILDMAIKLTKRRFAKRRAFTSPRDVKAYLVVKLARLEHETFNIMFLNNKHRLLSFESMFKGTIDGASVYPREVVKRSLELNAAAVIFVHNHPSGDAEPSNADKSITKRLKDALALVDVRVIDHLVVGGCEVVSMAELGYL